MTIGLRLLVAAALGAIVVLLLLRTAGGPGAPERPAPSRRPASASHPAGEPALAPAPPMRNVFEYAEGPGRMPRAEAGAAPSRPASSAPLPPQPSPSPAVRLVGLMRRGGIVRAALAISGETVVLAPGESSAGYTVVSIDEDDGVTLRTLDGRAMVLPPAPGE